MEDGDQERNVGSEDKSSSTYKQFNPDGNELRKTGYFGQADKTKKISKVEARRGDEGVHASEDADKRTEEAEDQIDTYRRPASLLAHHILR